MPASTILKLKGRLGQSPQAPLAPSPHSALDRPATRLATLTPAEREVAQQVSRGLLNKGIASVLGKAEPTVKHQVRSILAKTGLPNRGRLIAGLCNSRREARDERAGEKPGILQLLQSTRSKPDTRANSRVLFVTRVRPVAKAWPAISRS